MPSFRSLQAVEVFVCTPVGSVPAALLHWRWKLPPFKVYSLCWGSSHGSTTSPAGMYTQQTHTTAIRAGNWEAVSLPALPGVLFEACFTSGQRSKTQPACSGCSVAAPRLRSPRAALAHTGGLLCLVDLCRCSELPVHPASSHVPLPRWNQPGSKPAPGSAPQSDTGQAGAPLPPSAAHREQGHVHPCLHLPSICHSHTELSLQTSSGCSLGTQPAGGYLAQLQLQGHFSAGCSGMQPDLWKVL